MIAPNNGLINYWREVVRDSPGDMVELPKLLASYLYVIHDRAESYAHEARRRAEQPEPAPRRFTNRTGW